MRKKEKSTREPGKKLKFEYIPDTRKFPGQQCQDEELNTKFCELHHELVNRIISFCKENNITVDEFSLSADGLAESIPTGKWQACTDSGFILKKFSDDYKKAFWEMDKEFLNTKTKEELDSIEFNEEPFIFSM